jgi:hypothetical protein
MAQGDTGLAGARRSSLGIDLFGADTDSINRAIMTPPRDGDDWSVKLLNEFFSNPDAVRSLDSRSASGLFLLMVRAVFHLGAPSPLRRL